MNSKNCLIILVGASNSPALKRSKLEYALESVSANRFNFLESTVGPLYSKSTLEKHDWVLRLYKCFIQRFNEEPFPLSAKLSAFFVRFLGFEANYAIATIEDIFVPSLKRIHAEIMKEPCSVEVSDSLALAIKDIKRSPSHANVPDGKAPATYSDIKIIIEKTPEGVVSKAAETTLWLFALSTGARAVTCSNVNVGDIVNVIKKPDSTKCLVQVRLRVTKGSSNWNHVVTLEGDPLNNSSMDFIYWLRRHLKQSFNLDLENFAIWDKNVTASRLWDYSGDSMRQLFKSRAEFAGFSYDLFTFHSLRSGFICTAIMNAGVSNDAIKAVLEHTAYVAGWVPGQAAQLRYVKDCAKKSIVASRLVNRKDDDNDDEKSIVDNILTTSENFHCIKLGPSKWTSDTNYRMFDFMVGKKFTRSELPEKERKSLSEKCWRNAFNSYVKADHVLEKIAAEVYTANPSHSNSQLRWACETSARMKVGRENIAEILDSDYSRLDGLVAMFVDLVKDDLNQINPLNTYNTKSRVTVQSDRPVYSATNHRKRVKWAPDEDRIMLSVYRKTNSFVKASEALSNGRTNVDCKDRLNNIRKKYPDIEAMFKDYGL